MGIEVGNTYGTENKKIREDFNPPVYNLQTQSEYNVDCRFQQDKCLLFTYSLYLN